MRTVRDADGDTYLLLKRSAGSALVRDPATGAEEYRPVDDLEAVGDDPLSVAARAIPADVRRLIRAVGGDTTLGFLLELERTGPLPVRALLERYEFCESDLHGLLVELRVAGVVEEREVAGERGYGVSDEAAGALAALRSLADAAGRFDHDGGEADEEDGDREGDGGEPGNGL